MLNIKQTPVAPLLAVSILSADFGRMAEECRDALAQGADLLHLDVMDGHFAPNLTMGVDMIRGVRRHLPDAYLDVHLMVERPDLFIDMFAQAGASLFSFHVEVCRPHKPDGYDARQLIDRIHQAGMHAGLVVNPPTPLADLDKVLLPYLDRVELVLVMSVHPGWSGQKFLPAVLEKCRWIKPRLQPATRLEIDGGINAQTAQDAVAAGCDVLVSANAIFSSADRAAAIRQLKQAGQPPRARPT